MFRDPVHLLDPNHAELIKDGDELRNINSFDYLLHIADKIVLNEPNHPAINTPGLCAPPINMPGYSYSPHAYQIFYNIKKFFNQHEKDQNKKPIYEFRRAYGNIYTVFLQTLDSILPEIEIHRTNMLYQCLNYQMKINQYSHSIDIINKKISRLESDFNYYKENKPHIKSDSRYHEFKKNYEEKQKQKYQDDIQDEYNEEVESEIAKAIFKDLESDLLSLQTRLENLNKNKATHEQLIKIINEFLNHIDQVIDVVYANPNQGLERSANMIESVIKNIPQTSPKIETIITERLKGNSESKSGKLLDTINFYIPYRDVNVTTPQNEGSLLERGVAIVSPTFNPLKLTSMPSIRNYDYKIGGVSYPIEYRMGTQAQYHRGHARVSPIFESWLRVQKRKREAVERESGKQPEQTRITHIYFNNLALNRDSYEGKREVKMTHQLHALEKSHNNVAVITLPADKGIMDHHCLLHHQKTITLDEAFQKMLKIASGASKENVKDFYISENIKKLLYGDGQDGKPYNKDNEKAKIKELLRNSFEALGFSSAENLSEAELQAVYFHFIKFELTDFIITKLRPDSFNMSCKDGIDRAGVSSAYYNLMKSIKEGRELSEKEFIRALHGAPTMVKGRGMNSHSKLIWNAIDAYINANLDKVNLNMPWLIEWRNDNAPPHTKQYYINELKIYIKKYEQHNELTTVSIFKSDSIMTAKKMLALIENTNVARITTGSDEWIFNMSDKDLMKIRTELEKDHLFEFTAPPQNNKQLITAAIIS